MACRSTRLLERVRLYAFVAVTLSVPAPVSPHAIVLEASPAHDAVLERSPAGIVLRFNAAIEHALSRATVELAGGRPAAVPVSAAAPGAPPAADRLSIPLRPLPAGIYIVRFRVLAVDGHITEGALRFTVRAAR